MKNNLVQFKHTQYFISRLPLTHAQQNKRDVIYLKKRVQYKGTILFYIPDQTIKIETSLMEAFFVYKLEEIENHHRRGSFSLKRRDRAAEERG